MKVASKPVQRSAESDSGRSRPFFSRPPRVQARLRVGRSGDRFETEADAVADGLVHRRGPFASGAAVAAQVTPTTQRMPDEEQAQATPIQSEAEQPIEPELHVNFGMHGPVPIVDGEKLE